MEVVPDDAVSSSASAAPSQILFLGAARAVKWGPVAAVVAVIVWSYYVFVVVLESGEEFPSPW